MNKAKRLAILTSCGKRSPPHYRTAFQFAIRAADCRPAFCTGHRRKRQQSDSQTLSGGQYARSDAGPGVDGVKSYIKTIGLFNSKAENVIKTCRILLEQHNGEVPEDRAALEALPGVGRKTANVVLNTAFGWPTIAVDTHIFRVCNRTQFAPQER